MDPDLPPLTPTMLAAILEAGLNLRPVSIVDERGWTTHLPAPGTTELRPWTITAHAPKA